MNAEFDISGHKIGSGRPCFVIAELGVNHNGDAAQARLMIDAVAQAGANCVKFQVFDAETFCSGVDDEFRYVSQGKEVSESMLEMFRRFELDPDSIRNLFQYAIDAGLVPLATPCDHLAVDLLVELGSTALKIGSDDIVFPDLLSHAAGTGLPLIISTGMADETEISQVVETVEVAGCHNLALLHCVSVYPTPASELNLNKISSLADRFDLPVGYSDHSEGIFAPYAARAMGACIIEKHFTLDKGLEGPDHWFSADPAELKLLVERVRELEQSLGTGELIPSPGEQEMRLIARRSIVASRDLETDHVLTGKDLAYLRPGTGLLPYEAAKIIGRQVQRDIPRGDQITLDHLK